MATRTDQQIDARLGITIIAVTDLRRAADFYESAFAWKRAADVPVYIEYECGRGMRFGIYERRSLALNTGELPQEQSHEATTATELYVRVENVNVMFERLVAIGARPAFTESLG